MIDNKIIQQLRKYNLDKYTDYELSERQILLLTVLAEEIEAWEDSAYFLLSEFYAVENEVGDLKKKIAKQKKWQRFVYNKILKQPTPLEDQLKVSMRRVEELKRKIEAHNLKEPNARGYELAILGNRIFGSK